MRGNLLSFERNPLLPLVVGRAIWHHGVVDDSHPPVLQYLNPRTRHGLRSGFRQFPPVDRLVALAAVLLLPCAAMADADDEMEVWIVTVTAAALALIVLARWAVAILLAARPARATHPQMRKWRRAASVLVLAVWMVLIQGASCPHADYLRVGPWYFWWGRPCSNNRHFKPLVLWLLLDEHRFLTWTLPKPWQ